MRRRCTRIEGGKPVFCISVEPCYSSGSIIGIAFAYKSYGHGVAFPMRRTVRQTPLRRLRYLVGEKKRTSTPVYLTSTKEPLAEGLSRKLCDSDC